MEKIKEKRENQIIERVSDIDALAIHQSENASEKRGLVSVVYHISWNEKDKETYEGKDFEEDEREWYEIDSELPARIEYLRKNAEGCGYSLSDCCISLAEYKEPELTEPNISRIKTFFLFIRENENFYYSTAEDAREALLEHCGKNNLPTPNEIQYVVGGYYIKWNLERGYSGSEVPLWRFIQKVLHEYFAKLGSDLTVCSDATAMLYVSGFKNSDYVGFDLSEKVITIYSNDEFYSSPNEFALRLSLNVFEISEYRKIKEECEKLALKNKRSRKRTKNQLVEFSASPEITERAKSWVDTVADALRNEFCTDEAYRYYQYRTAGGTKKNPKWLEINGSKILPRFDVESDSWISAAIYYSRYRRKGNIASINCNFLILKWAKSLLKFTPTLEQGKELVLLRCRELGLPEPAMISTPEGLEIKWYWNDRMTKKLYDHDPYNAKFNNDWDAIQKKLYSKFWDLGADPTKLCVTVMFAVPGSKDTRKTLKSNDRIIREIHKGETVESYRDIQRILGIRETSCGEISEVLDEVTQQKWEMFSRDNPELVKDWVADVLRMHPSSENWVCFGFIGEDKQWKSRWAQAFELRQYLMKLVYKPEFTSCNCYVSQGEFFSSNDRTVNNLAAINVSFVDLDYKILVEYRPEITENPSPEEWEKLFKAHCEKFGIPLPNDVVFSGGGVHLKWIYDEAISRAELELWKYAQNLLLSQFKTLGADPNSSDAARVLRLVGTENHKDSPIIHERTVHVINREFFSGIKISLRGLVEGLEKSQPENPEEFAAVKSEWQKTLAQLSIREAKMLRPESEREIDFESDEFKKVDEDWLHNTLHHHHPRGTYIAAEISGVTKWIETYQLHTTLKLIYGTPNLKFSLAELKGLECEEKREFIEWIPCNYVVLSHCPGETFEEKKRNIFIRCHEYRGVGIPEPNQIITIRNTLLVEWTYQSVLTWRALSRWHDTQEFLCRHFEDWGAMDDPEYLKATALLPVPGFEYDGEIARLEYSDLTRRYTFNRLAKAVLPFSQKEAKEGKEKNAAEKAKHEPARKIALPEKVSEKILKAPNTSKSKFNGDFQIMALMRYTDIVKLLELQRLENGEIPQRTRELSCFWALVFARQGGLITTYEEFKAKAEELIRFCGIQFSTECTVKTLESAFTKDYSATTAFLITRLQITPEYQKHMKVLLVGVRATAKKRQPREEYLAEHTQEREKPWEKLGVCRATYFNWKRAGKLPSQVQVEEQVKENNFVPIQKPVRKREKILDRYIYIMSARCLLSSLLRFFDSREVRRYKVCAFLCSSSNYSSCL
ncbi:MAG: hypothetical protein IJQ74_07585, partial [Synergistaceae bacterium]|nr:hypothetical protein [Synergistaceae bacterium]